MRITPFCLRNSPLHFLLKRVNEKWPYVWMEYPFSGIWIFLQKSVFFLTFFIFLLILKKKRHIIIIHILYSTILKKKWFFLKYSHDTLISTLFLLISNNFLFSKKKILYTSKYHLILKIKRPFHLKQENFPFKKWTRDLNGASCRCCNFR